MIRALAAVLIASGAAAAAEVEVDVLGLFQTETLVVESADGSATRVEAKDTPFAHEGAFTLVIPGRFRRAYEGELRITVEDERLRATVGMTEREYLVRVAAAEMNRAPAGALEAQIIAARSYLRAAGRRHASAQLCDTTHCQWMADRPKEDHPAWAAVDATEGVVLRVDGRVVEALYSRSCGGRTRSGQYGADERYRAVSCPACSGDSRRPEGHQTGLCQRGALLLGREGRSAAEILRTYFPHAVLAADR